MDQQTATLTEPQRQGFIAMLQQSKKKTLIEFEKEYRNRIERAKAAFLSSLSGDQSYANPMRKVADFFGGSRGSRPVLDEEITDALASFDDTRHNLTRIFDDAILNLTSATTVQDARKVVEQFVS